VKLALISDVHANLEALQATLADVSVQGADRIVCLGDIVGYNTKPAECIALIRASEALCVAGNHDLAVCGRLGTEDFSPTAARAAAWTRERLTADELAFLRGLPLKTNIDNQVLAVHGALHAEADCASVRLDNDWRRLLSFKALMAHPSGARICAFGHTHHPGVFEFHDGWTRRRTEPEIKLRDDAYYLVNPGTVGQPRAQDRRASYMMLDMARRMVTLRLVEYDAAVPFVATRAARLAPTLSERLRSFVDSLTR
jgi:predicted phosphodiesterase